jgi:hypothetical protein
LYLLKNYKKGLKAKKKAANCIKTTKPMSAVNCIAKYKTKHLYLLLEQKKKELQPTKVFNPFYNN